MQKNRKIIVTKTKRNKGLEPKPTAVGILGHYPEIHEEDAIEFTYKLPLGAIKRLIRSYYETIKSIDSSGVYAGTSGSYEIRMWPYCYRVLGDIVQQLNKHGLDGKKIDEEVFNFYFKESYEKIERYSKNHTFDQAEGFKPCSDPQCCNYTNNPIFKVRVFWKSLKALINNFKGPITKDDEPRITWYSRK